ncbi:bacterial low temperature requirement A protein-domain-containing protein [Lipomyces arxii]|uniref:bacterial low temperature requirement A protein-domain-containing protein n=1 Tax=Lipomyces arxii TaxID=56418 RepID=UPI0034CF6C4B
MSEEYDFVQKYGEISVEWIESPPVSGLIIRPYALNYFHNGTLHRTKSERGSSTFELFFDLLYVGIVGNLAEAATEKATGASIGMYVLLFLPVWQVWTDMRDFMNYYYNNDITQKLYVLWIMTLLVIYANNASSILDSKGEAGMVVGSYILARFSAATITLIYTFFVKEHRKQMRSLFILVCISMLAIGFIIIAPLKAKIVIASVCYAYDIIAYIFTFHWFIKLLKCEYSTALSIEHEVERHGAFYVIALGEFLYVIVSHSPAVGGFNERLARAVCVLVTAYCFSWFYFRGEGSSKAVHALRRNYYTAYAWLLIHIPLILSLILAADASGDLTSSLKFYPYSTRNESYGEFEEIEENSSVSGERDDYLHSLQIIYGSGLSVALLCLTIMAFCDKSLDAPDVKRLSPIVRLSPRILVAGAILGMSFASMKITLYMGLTALFVVIQLIFETVSELPVNCVSREIVDVSDDGIAEENCKGQRQTLRSECDKESAEKSLIVQ